MGYDKNGVIKTVDCRGSFMTNSSDSEYAKYLNTEEWRNPANNCGSTIAARLTGRSDWETITKFYPSVHPAGDQPGPAALPLDVTEVSVIPPATRPTALPARYFDFRDAFNQRVNVAQGQGYLYQRQGTNDLRDDRVIPLGSTSRADRLRVRGASPDDRVCVYDDRNNPPRWGCEDKVEALSSTIKLHQVAGWAPNIVVEPRALPAGSAVITRTIASTASAAPDGGGAALTPAAQTPSGLLLPVQTVTETLPLFQPALAITVTLPEKAPPGQLNIQVLPAYEPGGLKAPMEAPWATAIALDATNPLTYTQVISLESRIASGFVRVWISDTVGSGVIRESITQFYIDRGWGQKSLAGLWGDSRGGLGGDSRWAGRRLPRRPGQSLTCRAGWRLPRRVGRRFAGGGVRRRFPRRLGWRFPRRPGRRFSRRLGGDSRGGWAVIPAAGWAAIPAAAWAAIPAAAWAAIRVGGPGWRFPRRPRRRFPRRTGRRLARRIGR